MNRKWKQIIMAFIGTVIASICVGALKHVALGTDPFNSGIVGLANLFHTTYGVAYLGVIGSLLVLVLFVDRHYIGVTTIFNLLVVGYLVDWATVVFQQWVPTPTLLIRCMIFLVAMIVLCFGCSFYITADLGVSSYDALALILADKKVLPFKYGRIGGDLICVAIGFSFHATIGIGTLITACFMGPIIDFFNVHVSTLFLNGGQQIQIKEEVL
ncbi:MAG: hypothetical protein RR920_07685 [Lachnospiraceae bacterium]